MPSLRRPDPARPAICRLALRKYRVPRANDSAFGIFHRPRRARYREHRRDRGRQTGGARFSAGAARFVSTQNRAARETKSRNRRSTARFRREKRDQSDQSNRARENDAALTLALRLGDSGGRQNHCHTARAIPRQDRKCRSIGLAARGRRVSRKGQQGPRRNRGASNQVWFRQALQKQGARPCDGSRPGRREERSRLLLFSEREKNSATDEATRDRTEERKSLREKSRRAAAGRKNFCPHRHIAIDDPRRSHRKNRVTRRSRQQQRQQE